ncbi:MAG: GTP-binding protein, partial [Flavobacteriaceae bacterium]|nr:GTP-binding protein [Flavobacteriaceae bacterium]
MQSIRNIAIIAHVDHGKTTLVDKIIDQAKILDDRKERVELLLDNNDLERERGITILSKNVSVVYNNVKINVIDTPGHADFGGEVERVLKMADGVLLLVDAFEGPMPQTRFVLSKALELGLIPIVVINKVDKENCTPDLVHEKVFDLMFALDATEEQLNFTTIYGSAKKGWMSTDWNKPTDSIVPLLDAVINVIPEAPYREGAPQMQITSLDYSSFTGRIAIGRIFKGDLEEGKDYLLCKADGSTRKVRIKELHVFEGMGKTKVKSARSGDICALTGIEDFEIGDTIADANNPEALPRIAVDQPTMSMLFTINTSPFFGKEGKFVTSRHLRDRLFKETEKNLALKVEETDSEDKFNVYGRGILHLSVLIETMRREGYELQLGRPKVIFKEIDGKTCEPYETLVVNVPEESASKVINLATLRKGDLLVMEPKGDMQHLEFDIPARGLIGLRNKMLTATAGEAIINHRLRGYDVFKGELNDIINGAIISSESGKATAYAIDRLQDRG